MTKQELLHLGGLRGPTPVRVDIVGMGPIGLELARYALSKPWIELKCCVDSASGIAGRQLGELLGTSSEGRAAGIKIKPSPDCDKPCDVVLHATGSTLRSVAPQLLAMLDRGCSVISTCEELAYVSDPDLARELDAAARARGAVLLGTGVNPGFVMDALPLMLTSVCQRVDHIAIRRVVDAATRRESLQRKVGAGLTLAAFEERVAAGTLRHVGLEQSLRMIASGLGWQLDKVSREEIDPVLATAPLTTAYLRVDAGQVAGVRQSIVGWAGGAERLRLDLEIAVGAANPGDFVAIRGNPTIEMRIPGGVHGDIATAAVVVHAIPAVRRAAPGLLTMAGLIPHFV